MESYGTIVRRRSVNAVTPPRPRFWQSRRRHGVHGVPCDWGITHTTDGSVLSDNATNYVSQLRVDYHGYMHSYNECFRVNKIKYSSSSSSSSLFYMILNLTLNAGVYP